MYLDEISLQPGIIVYGFVDRRLLPSRLGDSGVGYVGELCGGVVSPNDDVVHRIRLHTNTSSNLEGKKKGNLEGEKR